MSDPWWLEILLRLKRPENDEYSNVVQRLCQNILRRRLNLTKSFEDNFRALRLRTTSRCYEESSEFFFWDFFLQEENANKEAEL